MKKVSKILDLLTLSEKKDLLILLILIFFMALIDMVGVASILPFIGILSNPEIIISNSFLNYFYTSSKSLGVNDEGDFLFLIGILVFVILILALSTKAITYYFLMNFAFMREYSIGKRLVQGYLHQPYKWFLTKNSADLGRSVLSEVTQVIGLTIIPLLELIVNSTIIIFILTLLIIVDPIVSLSAGLILSGGYFIIYFLIKNILDKIGLIRTESNTLRFRTTSEAFGAIKEVKIGNFENKYNSRYEGPAYEYAKSQRSARIIALIPRYFLEALAFGGMIVIILFLMGRNGEFRDILSLITLYAFAGYKLMPALQKVYGSIVNINYSTSALDKLHGDIVSLDKKKRYTNNFQNLDFKDSIELKNINFSYKNLEKKNLNNISLRINKLNKIGIVGSTGSGKTTLIDIITGLLEMSSGKILIDGKELNEKNVRSWQKQIGYVPQQIYLNDDTLASNIGFGVEKSKIDYKAIVRASKVANLHKFVEDNLQDKYETIVGEGGIRLSGGQRQRIGIARALYHNPKLLILDEATSALDNITEKIVMEAIENLDRKMTIILIAHRLTTVKNCDTIFLLENGEIRSQGSFSKLYEDNANFQKMSDI
tara:strand:+ start:2654 stop:4447 length:1794 start_codon:yes stop_codon:yes gene_type:complete